jgi:hypothetical protein
LTYWLPPLPWAMASPCSPTTVITPIRSALFVPGLAVAVLPAIDPGGGKVPLHQVRCPPPAPAGPGCAPAPALRPSGQALSEEHSRFLVRARPARRVQSRRQRCAVTEQRLGWACVAGGTPGALRLKGSRGFRGFVDDGAMTGRRVAAWIGSGLCVAGTAAALVAWVGVDRANAYLGVPAAVAALAGLGISLYAVAVSGPGGDSPGRPVRWVRQQARASGRGVVTQVGGDQGGGGLAGYDVDQRAAAMDDGRIVQVGGDRSALEE